MLNLGKESWYQVYKGWVGPRASLDMCEKSHPPTPPGLGQWTKKKSFGIL